MEISMTTISSKGQIVIPSSMRKNFSKGQKLLIIKKGDKFILKKADKLDENFHEDLEFAKMTEEALKKYEKGEFLETNVEDFLDKVKKW